MNASQSSGSGFRGWERSFDEDVWQFSLERKRAWAGPWFPGYLASLYVVLARPGAPTLVPDGSSIIAGLPCLRGRRRGIIVGSGSWLSPLDRMV